MPRRRPQETDTSHERWLISYSDFITLLFGFFVVMYSVSQVNESKYRVLSETLNSTFERALPRSLKPIQVGEIQRSSDPGVIPSGSPEPRSEADPGQSAEGGAFDRSADLPQLSDLFRDEFADLINDQLVTLHSNELWLEVELKSSILFDSADAAPSPQARSIFADIARLLQGYDNPVQVEGFTDNVPINNARYPSNWELSTARAASVVKLLAKAGIEPRRLSAVGYGEFRPLADNDTPAGRAANRRVVLMIARERAERPSVATGEQIGRAVEPPRTEVSAPFPEPGQDQDQDQQDKDSPARSGAAQEQARQDTLPTQAEPAAVEPRERLEPIGEIQPVELEGGGLLFSSDPDLPRGEP